MHYENKQKVIKRKSEIKGKIKPKSWKSHEKIKGKFSIYLVKYSYSKPLINVSMKYDESTEEVFDKKNEKRFPIDNLDKNVVENNLVCTEDFEPSTYIPQGKNSPNNSIRMTSCNNWNVIIEDSSLFQDIHFPLLSYYNKQLLISVEKTEYDIDYDIIYDLNQSMIKLDEHHYCNRLANSLQVKQKSITAHNRMILLNWILEISAQFGFKRETYHLTVLLIDQFLIAYENLQTGEFQLLGITCLMISCKFEVKDHANFLGDLGTKSRVLRLSYWRHVGFIRNYQVGESCTQSPQLETDVQYTCYME